MKMRRYATDIVFLIDATASMQPGFDDLKHDIVRFFETLDRPDEASFDEWHRWNGTFDWRAAIYAYRDIEADGENWFESRPFVRGVAAVKDQLASLHAEGGGNGPTDLVAALLKVSELAHQKTDPSITESDPRHYRPIADRPVFVLTDKACRMPSTDQLLKLNDKVCEAHIPLCLFIPAGIPCYDELSQIHRCEWTQYPVPPGGRPVVALTELTHNIRTFTGPISGIVPRAISPFAVGSIH